MSKRFIGILLIIAGLVTPMHKEVMSAADKTVMVLFLAAGILTLLLSRLGRTEEDNVYRIQLQFDGIKLFNDSGLPALTVGQRLYVQPYSGPLKEDIHIMTAEGQFVAKMPEEHCPHVLHKYEGHCPVHLTVKSLQMDSQYPVYSLSVEMMC